ncbi:MAG: 50S ribosomal protein L15 [Saprospiraceae bacterium]
MKLHSLKPAGGSIKKPKRIARGQGSGRGGTSTKGHKGDKSRSGHKDKRNFEGGQMPLQMRLPKIGFKSPNRFEYVPLNLARLQEICDKNKITDLGFDTLIQLGIVRKNDKLKVLAYGELTQAVTVQAHAVSASAKAAIESIGGSVTLI